MTWQSDYSRDYEVKNHMECQNRSDKYIWSPHDAYFYKGLSELIVDIDRLIYLSLEKIRKDFVFINLNTDSLSDQIHPPLLCLASMLCRVQLTRRPRQRYKAIWNLMNLSPN